MESKELNASQQTERLFVQKFIEKPKQERILFELALPTKRTSAVYKIINNINVKKIAFSSDKISDADFKKAILKHFNKQYVYLLSSLSGSGEFLTFEKAFYEVMNGAAAYVVICGDNVVFMKDELEYGAPMKYLLISDSIKTY